MEPLRLMAVLAHPDDESLGFGGTLARYAEEGVGTYLVTASRGESGRFGELRPGAEGHPGREGLGRLREAELRAAAEVLGLREVSLLDYIDGEVDRADPREAADRIAAHVRRVRPQVVLSFAGDGGYGHPDHIAIAQFAAAALVVAADAGHDGTASAWAPHAVSKFYQIAWPAAPWEAYQAVFKKLTSIVDGVERQGQPWPDWAVTTVLDTRRQWPRVWQAVRCHTTQIGVFERLRDLPPERHEAIWGWQWFYRAFSTVNGGRRRESDLFEGLR